MKILLLLTCYLFSAASLANNGISETLDNFHQAAADADLEKYIGLFADNAVFLGTDPSERWTKAEFQKFVEPHFNKGNGWLYIAIKRNISLNEQNNMAFFDEQLKNENYGICRGSGVLVKTEQGWKIAQYNLSISIPNAITVDVVKQIEKYNRSHE